MNKDEMIKELEEAQKFIGKFYGESEKQTINNIVNGVDIDTEDVSEADNRISKVLKALKGDK